MTKKRLFAAGAAVALGAVLMLGAAVPAMAATEDGAGPTPTIAPGASGQLTTAFINHEGTVQNSNLTLTWTAPPEATFTDNILDYKTASSGAAYPSSPTGTYPSNACTLSNGNKTLSCFLNAVVPAGNNWAGYLWLEPHITVSASAPLNQTFTSTLTWTSNNAQITSGSTNPAFATPAPIPVPVATPAAIGVAGVLTAGAVGFVLMRRKRRSISEA